MSASLEDVAGASSASVTGNPKSFITEEEDDEDEDEDEEEEEVLC